MIDEILVHISTPATRQNDDLYRSLADAYLDFEPHEQIRKSPENVLAGSDSGSISRLEHQQAPTGSSLLSTSRESYGSFPSHISSVDHADVPGNVDIQSAEISSNPTSSRLARLDRIHKLWKEKTTPRSSFIDGRPTSSRAARTAEHVDTSFIEDTQLGAQALQSQLQDSYSTTDEDTSEDEAEPEVLVQLESSVDTNACEMITSNTIAKVADSARRTAKAALSSISANQRTNPRLPNISKPSPLLPSTLLSNKRHKPNEPSTETFDFTKLPVDAYPPAPKISTERPGKLPSQVTKHLAALKTQNPKRFKLSKRHGTPRYDDRGHWSVDTSTWPVSIQQEFWNSMHEHASSGRFGWGVTLYRDAASPATLGRVRLYCWAEIVEHTWLMMWLYSRAEIVKSGCNWIDADGNVMFEVAGK